nr:hypothetical protein [Neorhizobium tomejilense]
MDYPLDTEDHEARVRFAIEVAASRLAFALGTSWHRLSYETRRQETRFGPAVYCKATLRNRVTQMAAKSMPPDFLADSCEKTCAALLRLEREETPSIEDENRLADIASAWRCFSSGTLSPSIAAEAGKVLRGMYRRRTWTESALAGAAYEALFSLHSALAASVPSRYAQFVLESSFTSEFPLALSRETAVCLALDGEKVRDFGQAAKRILRRC